MLKWLLLLLGAVIVYRALITRRGHGRETRTERAPEAMVACAECGVFLPESDALREGAQSFCSQQHRALWNRTR